MAAKIDYYFDKLIEHGASDLHLSEGEPPKMRLHGGMVDIEETVLDHETMVGLLSEIAGEESWSEFMESGDHDFAYEKDEASRFRCNFFKQIRGLASVFRLIPTKIMTLEQLGIPSVVEKFGALRHGLVLVTGPTGSGKSTTLAALINHINENYTKHIITVEEPIEFVHENKLSSITQREVGEHAASFSDGLRAALREDTDIVLVGEMRDLETVQLALTAAETGLLVFGTLHTNSAIKTVDRLIDVFPSDQQAQVRTMISGSLEGVVAQLLMKKADGKGRLAVNEILVATPAVGAIIREGKTQKLQDVIVGGKEHGMQFMDDAIMEALMAGIVTPREAYMKGIDKRRFSKFLAPEDKALSNAMGA